MNVSQNIIRRIATSSLRTKGEIPQGYFDLKKIQARFQVPDGKPVHLKGGTLDVVLYRLTMGLSVVGLGAIGKLFYDLSWPKPI